MFKAIVACNVCWGDLCFSTENSRLQEHELRTANEDRGVYPYTLVVQLLHLQNWGEGNFRPFSEIGGRSKSVGNWILLLGLVDIGDKYNNLGTSV